MGRIHISGGDPVAYTEMQRAAALYQADPRALHQLLATLNHHNYPLPAGAAPHVGVDISGHLNPDGSPPNVEWLPLTPLAGKTITAAGGTQDFELKPTKKIRPGPLIIDDDVAKNVVMSNLTIGGKNVFAGAGVVPGRLFSHVTTNNRLQSFIASNNAPITFTLHNIHASVDQVVRGVWIGDTVEVT